MPTIDPTSWRACTCANHDEQPQKKPSRRSTFGTILRAAAGVASVALPGIGPAVGAIAGAIDRNRRESFERFDGTSDTLRYLELQRAIEQETRAFETASNVMKARHDATMNSIRNLKS